MTSRLTELDEHKLATTTALAASATEPCCYEAAFQQFVLWANEVDDDSEVRLGLIRQALLSTELVSDGGLDTVLESVTSSEWATLDVFVRTRGWYVWGNEPATAEVVGHVVRLLADATPERARRLLFQAAATLIGVQMIESGSLEMVAICA